MEVAFHGHINTADPNEFAGPDSFRKVLAMSPWSMQDRISNGRMMMERTGAKNLAELVRIAMLIQVRS